MMVVLDTETSGLNPGQICQLSCIFDDGRTARGVNWFFAVEYVEPGALAVHGFSPAFLRKASGGLGFGDRAGEIHSLLDGAEVIAGHNVSFDLRFLRTEMARTGRELNYANGLCTMYRFVKEVGLPGRTGRPKPPKLTELMAHFSVAPPQVERWTEFLFGLDARQARAHDARYDTAATWLCIHAAMQRGSLRSLVS